MDGIEKIIAKIEADAAAECQAIAAQAEEQCEEIKRSYNDTAKSRYWEIVGAGTKEAELRIERLKGVAAFESKKQILATKQEILSAAFSRAVARLCELPGEEYIEFFAHQAALASTHGDEQIILSAADRASYGKAICIKANEELAVMGKNAELTLSEQTRNIRGGLVLSSGKIEVNCTADTLVEQFRRDLSMPVSDILFD